MSPLIEGIAWGLADPEERDAGILAPPTLEQLTEVYVVAMQVGDFDCAYRVALEIEEMRRRAPQATEQQLLMANAAGLTRIH